MIPHETNRGGFYVICPNVTNKINNGNEKYFIAVAAMAFLAACSGKQAQKDVPVEVEEEEFAIMSAAPDAPSLPLIHSVKATQPAKPVNMRDSLKADPKKGPVIQKSIREP